MSTLGPMQRYAQIVVCLAIIATGLGCATVQGEKYTYKTIPRELVAQARENPQTIDFTRLASATTNSNTLDNGDVLELTIAASLNEKDTVKLPLRIQDDGCAELPEIGRLKLAGLDITSAEAMIATECIQRGLYRSPNITLLMKAKRMNHVTVLGAVKKPSTYELPRGQCDLLAALSKAEGLAENAGTQVVIRNTASSQIQLDRIANGLQNAIGNPETAGGAAQNGVDRASHSVESVSKGSDTIRIDLISATKNGSTGYQLQDGAIVYVEKRDPDALRVVGMVNHPGRFEFPVAEELRVVDAVAMAGGVNSIAADKIFVIRKKPADPNRPQDAQNPDQAQQVIIQVSLANAKQIADENIRLAPGDVISVEQTPTTFLMDRIQKTGFNFAATVPLLGLF